MLLKSLLISSKQVNVSETIVSPNNLPAAQRLARGLQFNTAGTDTSDLAMDSFMRFLINTYPNCTKNGKPKVVGYGLVYQFPGKNPALKPALFLAHLDVVPVDFADLKYWKFPPFSGTIANDTIYGRGSLDDKSIAMGMLEALEQLFTAGKQSERSIIFAFGADEEIGGNNGAAKIATYLKNAKITAEFIMDEGLGVTEGIVPGIANPCAIIGVAEKGYLTVKMQVKLDGGHSSIPKKETAISVLNAAISKIQKHDFDAGMCEPMDLFFTHAAPEMNFGYRFLFSNLWITKPLVNSVLNKNEKTSASIRTTCVVTMLQAGIKDNVVPNIANAFANFRIIPGSSIQKVMGELQECINDSRVQISIHGDYNEPSSITEAKGKNWENICTTIRKVFKNTVVVPGLVIAGTDCKHYSAISSSIYRFVPLRLNNNNTRGIHGNNEKIAAKNYYEILTFYSNLFAGL